MIREKAINFVYAASIFIIYEGLHKKIFIFPNNPPLKLLVCSILIMIWAMTALAKNGRYRTMRVELRSSWLFGVLPLPYVLRFAPMKALVSCPGSSHQYRVTLFRPLVIFLKFNYKNFKYPISDFFNNTLMPDEVKIICDRTRLAQGVFFLTMKKAVQDRPAIKRNK